MNLYVVPASKSKYQRFRNKWIGCNACPLGATATERVFTRGQIPADVVFIGSAPGETEDVVGKPFAGRTGRILDTLLREVIIDWRGFSYCLTNVICCRATDMMGSNRSPSKLEAAACSPRLSEFLILAEPLAIVTLGKVPTKFLPESSLPVLSLTDPLAWLLSGGPTSLEYKRAKVYLTKFLKEHVDG